MLTIPIYVYQGFSNRICPENTGDPLLLMSLHENETHNSLHAALRFCMFVDVTVFTLK